MSANPGRKLLRRRLLATRTLHRKPVGVWGWRVAHGARQTRATTAGGRAHTAGSHVQRHAPLASWRKSSKAVRRAYIARRIKDVA